MNYNLICHDGKLFSITELQKEAIYRLSGSNAKGVDIDGEFIFFGNIARIEKEAGQEKTFLLDTNMPKAKREKALNSIINGFNNYFSGREIPVNAQEMLDNMIKRYDTVNK